MGALVFPAGLLLAVLLAWNHPGAIAYAALVLGVADPAAAQVGKHVHGVEWPVIGGHKTLAGSLTFAAVTVGIGLAMSLATGDVRIFAVIGAAAVLSLVEGSLGYGLDNVPVPAVGSLLGISMLGL